MKSFFHARAGSTGWLVLLLCWPLLLLAQHSSPQVQADSTALNALYGDFDAPDLTAPTLLGVNANKVSKPANVRALAGSLLGTAGSFGQNGNGIGVEVAPAQLFHRLLYRNGKGRTFNNTLEAYQAYANQIGRGFTLSGASIADSARAKLAFGIGVVLLDRTDPLLDKARVDSIHSQLFRLTQVDDFASFATTYTTATAGQIQKILNKAGLLVAPGSIGDELFNQLKDILALPPGGHATIPTADAFALNKADSLKAFQDVLRSDTTTGRLNATQASVVSDGAIRLLPIAVANYLEYKSRLVQMSLAINNVVKKGNEAFEKNLWNATIVQGGLGWAWNSKDQRWSHLKAESFGLFLRGAFRPASPSWKGYGKDSKSTATQRFGGFLYSHTQVVGLVQLNHYNKASSTLPTDAKAMSDSLRNSYRAGVRALLGGASLRISGEYAFQRNVFTDAAQAAAQAAKRDLRTNVHSATIGAEVKLADKLWLEFAFGTTWTNSQKSDAKLLTLANLKYAIRNRQRFKTN